MSSLMRAVIDTIWPRGSAWEIAPNEDLDKFLDGSAENWEAVRAYLSGLSEIRTPSSTPFLADLEREFGVFTDPNLTEQQRRDQLTPIVYGRGGNGSVDFLQNSLDSAGFNVQVHENSPAVDPDILLDQSFRIYSNGVSAYSGNVVAICGSAGGELIVNGELYDFIKNYDISCGSGVYSGATGSPCGSYES